ncbi:ribonucleoside triphosphate reductase, partial [Patescibacteria group bacterium]|nr:ribonucleoside triphosphate reductase [Patescibacteria group bacterium]
MYNLRNRIQDQLISPGHRVVRKVFNTDKYILEDIEKVARLKSPVIIPVAGKNPRRRNSLSDEQIKLMAWIISEGTIERPTKYRCCYRVSIYQSVSGEKENFQEIKKLLDHFGLKYYEYESASLGKNVGRLRLTAESSKKIHEWFGTKENVHFIPDSLLKLDQEQSRLFLETYLRGDGFEGCKITTTDFELLGDLQQMVVNCGYGFTVMQRKPTIGKKTLYVLRIIKHADTYITKIEKVDYGGIIWCPHTKNETVIARRNGKVFITGNTPFSNITLDLVIPEMMKKEPVIIGGEPQKKTYGEFQEEINIFNKALGEVYIEGDAQGRVFSFPIPTINITKDFDWKNPYLENLWEATRKYGIPYFSNFVNSDMKPEDVRSMCCRLRLSNKELYKKGGGLFGANPLT